MKFNEREIFSRAIEEGISLGYNRAHKHHDSPPQEVLKETIEKAIWDCLDEVIIFETVTLTYSGD